MANIWSVTKLTYILKKYEIIIKDEFNIITTKIEQNKEKNKNKNLMLKLVAIPIQLKNLRS